jgi:hypothetical protein
MNKSQRMRWSHRKAAIALFRLDLLKPSAEVGS